MNRIGETKQTGETSRPPRFPVEVKIFLPMLILVWVASLAYMHSTLMRGWVPHDEGAIAQAAERVLQGELPHRDFDDIYTGGLALLDAAAFRVLGTNLASLRWAMFLFFAAWVPVIYYIASRFASPLTSAAVTSLSVTWSVPNYAAPMPSWYNLFFAAFSAAALLHYLENNRTSWLIVAGICGGLSCLAKITGLYCIAAALLFFIFREQTIVMESSAEPASQPLRLYPIIAITGLLAFLIAVLKTVGWTFDLGRFIHFVLPSTLLVILLLCREAGIRHGLDKDRFTVLLKMLLPFLMGVSIPIAAFLAPYVVTHSVQSVIDGVFVSPGKRLYYATMAPQGLHPLRILVALALAALLYGLPGTSRSMSRRVRAEFILFLAAGIVFSSVSSLIYQFVWSSVILLIPVTVIASSTFLWRAREQTTLDSLRQQQIFLLSAVVGVCGLVQFPFSAPIYFCYVAPLLALATLAVIASRKRQAPFLHGSLLLFFIAFAVLYTTPGFVYKLGETSDSDKQIFQTSLPRAGNLKISRDTAQEYQTLISLVQQHAGSRYIYAAPDCPEVYFLGGFLNPTRTIFDFFNAPFGRTQRIIDEMDAHAVNVVVLNTDPQFSPSVSPDLLQKLERRFANGVNIGRFQVRWRE